MVERDDVICVSAHKKFLRPQESQQFTELKANWARACKQRGHRPTDVNAILFSPTTDDNTKVLQVEVVVVVVVAAAAAAAVVNIHCVP